MQSVSNCEVFYYKTTAKKMISTTTSPAAAKEPDVQSHSSQLDLIRRHLRPEKRINRRQTHTDFSLDISILTPVTGEQVSSQNEPLPNRQRDKMPPSLKKNSKLKSLFTIYFLLYSSASCVYIQHIVHILHIHRESKTRQ